MKKIFLIIEREFLTRVKKKSFILTTILVPVLLAGLMVVPFLIQSVKDDRQKTIIVVDRSGLAEKALVNADNIVFHFRPEASLDSLKQQCEKEGWYAIVTVSPMDEESQVSVGIYAFRQINMEVQNQVKRNLEKAVEQYKLDAYQIPGLDAILASIKTKIPIKTFVWGDDGKEKATHTGLSMGISYILSFMIYMFIFMFGSMVMRGVIEEKNNRIVEVIVSSVKPFQLMMGKITGVASVGLLQFIIWILLTLLLAAVGQSFFPATSAAGMAPAIAGSAGAEVSQVMNDTILSDIFGKLNSINFVAIIAAFLLYFLFGYFLYAALFAAIGSAVENEADTQQLTIPVTIPLILGIFLMMHTFQYPDSSLSFWGSIIPFTSPMVMMARIPFGVPFWQIALSLSLLFLTFIATVWFAGKIYRVGILMYGKKPTLKEMWKWVKYKS
ncbi:MAG: ABC transporter permease [Prevotellaceae bacterium]|jgi:ABC-2 type transport system permease protein|nr:ABC transporter permease [Prevotellaceae bacterium]